MLNPEYDPKEGTVSTEFEYLGEKSVAPQDLRTARYPKKPGKKLPNGGIIVQEHIYDERWNGEGVIAERRSIVLCVLPSSMQPFATWDRYVTSNSPMATGGYQIVDTCVWGHYHDDLVTALEDFFKRLPDGIADTIGDAEVERPFDHTID